MLLAPAAFNTALVFHQAHLAEVKGWCHAALVALFPVYPIATVAAMLAFAAERIMQAEVEARTGAAKGARTPMREVQRNGYRDWD